MRALLADARHTDPTPPEVVARLEDTLADLTADRREVRAPVVTLASRRRRRVTTALIAAAAVVVGGVGLGQLVGTQHEGADTASSAGSAEDTTSSGAEPPTTDALQERTAAPEAATDPGALTSGPALRSQLQRLREDRAHAFEAGATCPVPGVGAGVAQRVAITYDDVPGVAVFRAPVRSGQRVEVYVCGDGEPQESVRLPAQ